IDPVRIDLMARIEIRDSAQLVWRPGIDDLTGKASPFVLINAFRIGSNVYGLGKGVVDVGFQPAHPMPEAELPAVVTAVANGTPAVQRSILRIVKLVRRGDAVDGGASWKTEHVRLPQCPSLVVNPAVIHGIHILRRRGITGRNSQKLTWWPRHSNRCPIADREYPAAGPGLLLEASDGQNARRTRLRSRSCEAIVE